MKTPANGAGAASAPNSLEGEKKIINPELWQACAGPLVNLPPAGTHVVYFPQGHSEQVAASMKKDADAQIPNYPNLPSKILCLLHNVTLHADPETDEVYAQMTLQPVSSLDKDALLRSDLALKSNKPQPEFFCKTLTASDTSTHGGFSVPRRAAEKIFPSLDFSLQPPAQELTARDLHDNVWRFRHIYRGQPKRHLLTTGWSLFVSGKRLLAGDSVLFIRDERQQLLLGIRRANRQPTNLSSSVLSSDSMHIGILAAAAHAAANNSPFNVFYNPRASPSEFVIPLAKYYKAVYGNQLSLGMRFRMMFETEDSGTRRYMGTITGISDLDPIRWKNSQWRNLQVGWDESTAGERRNRVSIWEIEPVIAPFFICPPPFLRSKRPRQPGMPDDEAHDMDSLFKRAMPWLGDDGTSMKDSQALPGLSLVQWMNMQQNPSSANSIQTNYIQPFSNTLLQNLNGAQIPPTNNLQFNTQKLPPRQLPQFDQLTKLPSGLSPLGSVVQTPQQSGDVFQQPMQNLVNQSLPSSQVPLQILQPQALPQSNCNNIQQQPSSQSLNFQRNLHQSLQMQNIIGQTDQQNAIQSHLLDQANQQLPISDNQANLQLLQRQQQSLQSQQSALQQQAQLIQLHDQQRQLLDVSHSFSTATPSLLPQSNQFKTANLTNNHFSLPTLLPNAPQQTGVLSDMSGQMKICPTPTTNHISAASCGVANGAAGLGQSVITDEVPSCSTSPSTNNYADVVQPLINGRIRRFGLEEEMAQSASKILSPNSIKDLQPKPEVKSSIILLKNQEQCLFSQQTFLNGATPQTDFLDSSSSTTAVCLSQNEARLQQNNWMSFNSQPLLRNTSQELEVPVDQHHNFSFGSNMDGQVGEQLIIDPLSYKGVTGISKDFSNIMSSNGTTAIYENPEDPQKELASPVASQSFGVPDMAFNSIDSTINDSSFLTRSQWAPPPQIQRMRTFTKVYKRGAVGRSIDMTRYSGYDELKQDLARRFGIEGQLEDRQRIGWKLVYVDHENDVLLVGDDPWEEFVSCVRCIKILSPQEVQQMSMDGDIGNGVLQNQACSSSDCRNT